SITTRTSAHARCGGRDQAHGGILARVVRSLYLQGPLARRGDPLAHHPRGAHLCTHGGIVAAPTTSLPDELGLACSFWLAANYALAGRIKDAVQLFERFLSPRNPLGLLSEEYDPILPRQIGNFPQGFSQLARVASASTITSRIPMRHQPAFAEAAASA